MKHKIWNTDHEEIGECTRYTVTDDGVLHTDSGTYRAGTWSAVGHKGIDKRKQANDASADKGK